MSTDRYRHRKGRILRTLSPKVAVAAFPLCLGAAEPPLPSNNWSEPVITTTEPLDVLEFFVGTLVPRDGPEGNPASRVQLEWGVGRQAVSFTGFWDRAGEPPDFVEGLIGWDPVDEELRNNGVFYHGAFFSGRMVVLDRANHVVRREWEGRYPDGSTIPYRETWTPISEDEFEWKIEFLRNGEWQMDLRPGAEAPAVHRVLRKGAAGTGDSVDDISELEPLIGTWHSSLDPSFRDRPEVRTVNPELKPSELSFTWGTGSEVILVHSAKVDGPSAEDRTPYIDGVIAPNPASGNLQFLEYNSAQDLLFEGIVSVLESGDVERVYDVHFASGGSARFRERWEFLDEGKRSFDWYTDRLVDGEYVQGDIVVRYDRVPKGSR